MLVPALGFALSAAFFAVVGWFVLPLAGIPPVRKLLLGVFVGAAQVGALTYAAAFGAIFADATDHLQSTGAILTFLGGMPLVGTLVGLVAARGLSQRPTRSRPFRV